ncbi:hypothetical protein D3C72_1521380 [compost metagenome]
MISKPASTFHDRPARKMTVKPAATTNSAVPRSGWRAIRYTGTSSSTAAIRNDFQRRAPALCWKNQASISGVAIFRNSDGWMSITPICSQRRAPSLMVPNSATATSRITDTVYTGTAMRIIICGVTLAATHMTKKHSRMLRR